MRFPIGFLTLLLLCGLAADAESARRRRTPRRPPPPPKVLVPEPAAERDLAVAEACRSALDRRAGAVVAMDPHTGRVLAVINPHFGLERAYQPCSVFKIAVAVAGLSEGLITPDSVYNCARGCWMWPGHGLIDLRRALAVSCNPFFEWMGEQLGYPTVERYARLLGLGEATGINAPREAPGRLPSFVAPSRVGHLSSHAAGIKTSALQLAVLLSATVNGGVVYQPQIAPAAGFVPKVRWRLPEKTVYKGLIDGFLSAVNEGSATGAFDPEVLVAGKTGSCSRLGWFASYAPADRPEIVIVVFLFGGSGHRASDVAGRIYQALYRLPAQAWGAPTVSTKENGTKETGASLR